jgi:MoaA/NifB/PqqE/SkfB family radical SAM enzyme
MWFHIRLLEACNLHCSHCYAGNRSRSPRMDLMMFRDILDTIGASVDKARRHRIVLYLSGGEPLIHPEFAAFLAVACARAHQVNVLTNGAELVRWLPTLERLREKVCIQVSLDGGRIVHDAIRGPGTFDGAVAALHALDRYQLRHWLSYTVSRINWHCHEEVLQVARATQSYVNNVTPYTGDPTLMLDYLEWKEFKYRFDRTAMQMGHQPAHSPNCCGYNYWCAAFHDGLTINPDGSLSGCARLSESVGSYREMSRYLHRQKKLMHETCMNAAWGKIANFALLSRLEC